MATRHTEEFAVQTALHGRPRDRLAVAGRALVDLMKNPDDTSRVFLLGIVANRRQLPQFLARFVASDDRDLLRDRPEIDSKHTDLAALRALPGNTLGACYVAYLDRNGLDPDLFQAPPGLPAHIAYIAQRLRQTHDIWHVLTNYAPDVVGEVALQAFTFAQTKMPSSGLIALAGSIRFLGREPRLFAHALDGFSRGRKAHYLPTVRFEDMWTWPLDDVRKHLGITPMKSVTKNTALAA